MTNALKTAMLLGVMSGLLLLIGETLGGGPYAGTPPATASYPASGTKNAIYYCSQNIVAEAQCSRSDDGGVTFGPGVPIFSPSQCTGGIHGHVKVAPDGTVYKDIYGTGWQKGLVVQSEVRSGGALQKQTVTTWDPARGLRTRTKGAG